MSSTKTAEKKGTLATPPLSKSAREITEKLNALGQPIDMKGAVQKAIASAIDFYPEAKDIRLEQVEPVSAGWSVVVSFTTGEPSTLAFALGQGQSRIFKTITIDAGSGQAQSLRIWKQ